MTKRLVCAVVALCAAVGCVDDGEVDQFYVGDAEESTLARFERVRSDPAALTEFLAAMPLGGDLHHHIGGAALPEMMIGFAVADGLCLPADAGESQVLTQPPCSDGRIKVVAALEIDGRRTEIVRAWSMIAWEADDPAIDRTRANDHFFAIFPLIRAANLDLGRLLAGVRSQAAEQGVAYLETSSGWVPDRAARRRLYATPWSDDFAAMRESLLANPVFTKLRDDTVAALPLEMRRSEELLGCGGEAPDPGCEVEVRFQRIAVRSQPPAGVFVQTLLAYEVAQASDLVLAVNLVAPETAEISLRDYALHMRMYGFLSELYPEVRCSLHAAEMTNEQAVEFDARDHLALAIAPVEENGAAAHRLGHAVALDAESDRIGVLETMRQQGIAVEQNLRSNFLLLGVEGDDHPIVDYLAADVPIVLSTDDPGLMHTTLGEQFAIAAGYPEIGYRDLKRFARNSIGYSFLAAADKSLLLARLDREFDEFEATQVSAEP